MWRTGDRLYTDPAGRRIVLDVADPGAVWGGSAGVFRVGEVDDALVLAADEGPVTAWALPGPTPKVGPLTSAARSFSGTGWLVDVEGLAELDGRPLPSIDLPMVPVWTGARFRRAGVFPTGQSLLRTTVVDMKDGADLAAHDGSVRSSSKPSVLASGCDNGDTLTESHVQHLGPAEWQVVDHTGEPLVLAKLYDRFHGLQRARVYVDGVLAGTWQAMRGARDARWAWSWFGLPAGLPPQFRLAVDPLPGTPLWDVARYEVLRVVSGTFGATNGLD